MAEDKKKHALATNNKTTIFPKTIFFHLLQLSIENPKKIEVKITSF